MRSADLEHLRRDLLLQFGGKSLAALLTRWRNFLTTSEESPRREARLSAALGLAVPLRERYTTPSMFMRCSDEGTNVTPSPAADQT